MKCECLPGRKCEACRSAKKRAQDEIDESIRRQYDARHTPVMFGGESGNAEVGIRNGDKTQ